MAEQIEVKCPECPEGDNIRLVVKKSWKKKDGGPPYVKLCKKHAQTGKKLSEATKNKLRGRNLSEETKEKIRQARLARPDLIENLVAGAGAAWNKGKKIGPMPEEVKEKISNSMKGKNKKS